MFFRRCRIRGLSGLLFLFLLLPTILHADDSGGAIGDAWDGDGDGICRQITAFNPDWNCGGPGGTSCGYAYPSNGIPDDYWQINNYLWVEFKYSHTMPEGDDRLAYAMRKVWVDSQNTVDCPEPDPCEDANKDPVTDCGTIENVTWDNVDTCEYHCSTCDDEFDQAETRCGSGYDFNNSDCSFTCDDCPETNCEFGTIWIDETTCDFECVEDCNESFDVCYNDCYSSGGISRHACQSDSTGAIVDNTCECRYPPPEDPPVDPPDVPDPDPGVDPEDPVDPPDNPPADDPTGDPDDGANGWLKAIKENTDILVDQGDADADRQEEHTVYLKASSENTKAIAGNTVAINESVIGVGNKVDGMSKNLGEKLDGVVSAIEGIEGTDLTNVESKLDTLIENTGTPDDFDSDNVTSGLSDDETSTLQDMKDYVEDTFTEYEGVSPDDASWFGSLYTSILPPTGTCVPLDLSVRGHVLIIGCQYDSEVKTIMAYFLAIVTIITIFQLVRKELVPKTSSG